MSRLAILGAGGHGQVLAEAAEASGWQEIVFFDQRWREIQTAGALANRQWSLGGTWDDFLTHYKVYDAAAIGIGDSVKRLTWIDQLTVLNVNLPVIIHPKAVVSRYAKLGVGTVVFAGAVVQTLASLGRGCIVNTNSSVDHHCKLADGVHVCPGANLAGGVTVGVNSWIGIGSSVKELVTIGSRSTVGAGAAVVSDIPDDVVAVGVPARIVKKANSNAQ